MNLRWQLIENIGVLYTINGEEKTAMVNLNVFAFCGTLENEIELIILPYEGQTMINVSELETDVTIVIKEIYDAGHFDLYFEEDGFRIELMGEKWCLAGTPSGAYTVPTTVAGKNVDIVFIDNLNGTPTFAEPVKLSSNSLSTYNPWSVAKVVVTTADVDFIFDVYIELHGGVLKELDLSACGDNITIPENVLANGYENSKNVIIYVNETVKAKYADYDFIQVKPTE